MCVCVCVCVYVCVCVSERHRRVREREGESEREECDEREVAGVDAVPRGKRLRESLYKTRGLVQ